MSMGSNMMGMQGPTHSSSCSSTHIPSMHSEAKLVSICMNSHGYVHIYAHTYTSAHTPAQSVATSFFHWTVPAKLCF